MSENVQKSVPVYHVVLSIIGFAWTFYLLAGVIWSLQATISYSSMAMREAGVGTMIGVIVQFSQQGALFIKNRVKQYSIEWWACWGLFVASFVLDTVTNIGEWRMRAPLAKNTAEQTQADFFGISMCVGATMFEEILSYAAAMTMHHVNEVLRAMGRSFRALEWVEARINETKIFGAPKSSERYPSPSGRPPKSAVSQMSIDLENT